MAFNNERDGVQNEFDFIKIINGKRVKNLSIEYQLFIQDIFGNNIKYYHTIYAWKNGEPQKTDIFIRLNDSIKRISIKKGVKSSVHVENISDFILFLKENNIPKNIINKYLKYHFADGSINGTGSNRISALEYKKLNQNDIDEVNIYFQRDDFVNNAIERFILKGRNDENHIDAILFGVPDDFLWIKKEEIEGIINKKKKIYSTGVHIGPLWIQPQNRALNCNVKYESKRFCVQVKWYNLIDDIIESMNDNN